MTVYGSVNIGESSKMSTSLSQAANFDNEPVPMDSASSVDKIMTAEIASEHRGRGAGFSGSTSNRQSTPPATISALLPPLPISPPRTQKRSQSMSPPLTPPSGPSAQFSTPVGPSPSQSSRKTPSHPNDSPALLSPFRGQGDRSGPTGSARSPGGRPTTPKPNPWHPLLQSQSGRSTDDPQVEQSPSRWHRQSFARGGGSSDDDGEDRLVEGMEHSLILVPHESEEEFMSNVHRIVPDGEVGTPSPEERTPSPVIPGMEGVESKGKGKGVSNLAGGSRAGPSSMSSYPATPRRPETRPARVGAASHTPVIPQRRERADKEEAPARVRITRARDAKEAEEAIALVDAFEAQTSVKSKGKGKETQGRSKPRGKSAVRAEPDSSVMQPSTPPRQQSSLPRPVPAQRHIRNTSQTNNSPLPKSLILAEKGVAIAVSPVKGRRLKLLRPATPPAAVFGSSPPKFEENISPAIRRWLAGPRSPPSPPKPREKKRRFEEEQEKSFRPDAFAALGIRIDSVPQLSEKIEAAIQGQERESKKRKRLEAFRDSSSDSSTEDKVKGETQQSQVGREKAVAKSLTRPRHVSPLKPAQVDGLGRMAIHPGDLEGAQVIPMSAVESGQTWRKTLFGLDVQEEDESLMSDVTTGGAGLRNLWRHRSQKSDSSTMPNIAFPDDMSLNDARLSQSLPGQAPGWPDLRFPWSTNEAERRTERQRKRSERLAMVESFLTRESDSDSDSDMPATSISGTEEDVTSVRGLWSLGQEDSPRGSTGLRPRLAEHFASLFPSAEGSSAPESGLLSATPMPVAPSDPADARIALASRRDVRSALYFSVKRREEDEADEGVVDCICGEPDDGRAMVRCDGCKTWSHQICAGINDENELGECWYCAQCARETASTTHEGSAPTLVQGDASPERVVERAERRTALFMAPTNEEGRASSPMDIPSSPALAASRWPFPPKTPRAKERGSTAFLKTHSHPFESRLHQTPHFFPDPDPFEVGSTNSGLDLLGTPSRGTKYNVAFVPTSSPRQSSSSSTFRRTLVGASVFATPKNTSSRRFVGGNNSAETALSSDGGWSVAATLKDQPGLPATPRPHYSMSLQYTDTPIQRSLPRMGNTNQAIAPFSAPFDSPIVREGNGSR